MFGRAAGEAFRSPPGRSRDGGHGGSPRTPGRRGENPPPRRSGNDRAGARPNDTKSTTDDPIDVVTGEVLLTQTDVELPGALPLLLQRTHISTYRAGRLFGTSWASTLDQHLEPDSEGVHVLPDDATVLKYPQAVLPNIEFRPVEGPQRPLVLTSGGGYELTDPHSGRTLHFPAPGEEHGWSRLPLVAISDRNGDRVELLYEDQVLVEVRHSGGYRIAVDSAALDPAARHPAGPDSAGPPGGSGGPAERRITALRLLTGEADDPPGGVTLVRYGYDERGHLAEVTDSSGRPLRFTYDDEGRLTGWVDRNGFWYRYEYDGEGRAVRATGKDGYLSATLSHDPGNRTTVVTDALGHATTYRYNELFQVVSETDPLGATTRTEWDRHDRPLARTDALGRTTRYTYDEHGDLTAVAHPDGTRATAVYDASHRPIEITDVGGAVWRQSFDAAGNLVEATDPAGSVQRYARDERGRLTSITDPLGNVTRVETDPAGLHTATIDPLGGVTRYSYDAAGRLTGLVDPVGGTFRYGRTPEGRLAWRTLPDGTTERWSHDPEGNRTEYVDALGRVVRTEYGAFDLPVAQIGADGARLEFTHDSALRLTAVTNPQGLVWRYEYDAAGNLVRESDFNGRVLEYAYDGTGRLASRTNGLGQTIAFTRDARGLVVEKRSDDGVTSFSYTANGWLESAANAHAELRFERDALGRVTAEHCNGRPLLSSYDARGRRVRRRTPTGSESRWEYDAVGLPRSLAAGGQSIHFEHDAAGREVQRRIGAGAVLSQVWDAAHRLTSQTVWGAPAPSERRARLLQHRGYAYRADGAVAAIGDRLGGDRTLEFDGVGRVTAVHAQGWTERYAYDTAGNIAQAAGPTADPEAQGDREYTGTMLRRAGSVRYEHDAAGRVLLRQRPRLSSKPDTWRYRWSAEDRLTGVETPDGRQWRYHYDPLGRRIAKTRLAPDGEGVLEQVDFAWDGPVLAERVERVWSPERGAYTGSSTVWEYEPGGIRPLAQLERAPDAGQGIDERFYAIVADLVGTPAEMVDASGQVVWHPRRNLWGGRTEPAGTDCPLQFPGQYRDRETGLDYNHHRYYDSATSRYQSGDPIGLRGGTDPHAYVSNPMEAIDPLGLAPCKLNMGAGQNPMPGAVNMDRTPGPGVDVVGDANHLPFRNGAFNEVHAVNPYGYNPVNPETARVLEPGGTLSVTGSPKNKFIKPPADLEGMGFRLEHEGPMIPEHGFGTQRLTNGSPLSTTDNHITRRYRRI